MSRRNTSLAGHRPRHARTPSNQGAPCVVRVAVTMAAQVVHSMIRSENEGSLIISVKTFLQLGDRVHTSIHHLNVVHVHHDPVI
jgi:hypothetical protein